MKRLTIAGSILVLAAVTGCNAGSGGDAPYPPITYESGPAATGPATAGPTEPAPTTSKSASRTSESALSTSEPSATGASASGTGTLPVLRVDRLPRLRGWTYLEAETVGDPVLPPSVPKRVPVLGLAVVGLQPDGGTTGGPSLEVLRLDAAGVSDRALDRIVTDQAEAVANGRRVRPGRISGVTAYTVPDLQGTGITGVFFRVGADVVMIFSTDARAVRSAATAYLRAS